MWSTEKNRSSHNEPRKLETSKFVASDETAELRTRPLKKENRVSALAARARKKATCIVCSGPSNEMICGACTDKIKAEALEHKRWEEKGGR
jgi:hypothetical protein